MYSHDTSPVQKYLTYHMRFMCAWSMVNSFLVLSSSHPLISVLSSLILSSLVSSRLASPLASRLSPRFSPPRLWPLASPCLACLVSRLSNFASSLLLPLLLLLLPPALTAVSCAHET